jgi:hypothetical protein
VFQESPGAFYERLPAYKTAETHILKEIPRVQLDVVTHIERATGQRHVKTNQRTYPQKMFGNRRKFKWVEELWAVKLSDIMAFHVKRHENTGQEAETQNIVLSLDDVPTDKSSGISMTICSVT